MQSEKLCLDTKMRNYRQINERDRRKIAKLKSYKYSISEIARRTGFHKSTISREIRRNGFLVKQDLRDSLAMAKSLGYSEYVEILLRKPSLKVEYWAYNSRVANHSAKIKKKEANSHQKFSLKTQEWIAEKLHSNWSPEQIAGRSRLSNVQTMSHEYVYQYIIKDKKQGGKLYQKLKRFRKRKQRLGRRDYQKECIPERVAISKRPQVVEHRKRVGDIEGDLVAGSKQSGYILTLVDRKSRFLVCELLKTRKMEEVQSALLKGLKRMPEAKTLTLDNAREFSCHKKITSKTGVKVYFADPYASHQRGTNENTNGLIRYYLPKKKSFSEINDYEIRKIERQLNTRPRKILDYLTPQEARNRMAI